MAEEKKKKSNAGVWIVLILLIIILLVVFSNKARANQPKLMQQTAPTGAASGGGSTTTYVTVTDDTILKKGMDNETVAKLQTLINKVHTTYGMAPISVDGDFGSGTEAALYKLTGKKEISYNQALAMANEKFKAKGYTDSMITSILHGLTFGLFT